MAGRHYNYHAKYLAHYDSGAVETAKQAPAILKHVRYRSNHFLGANSASDAAHLRHKKQDQSVQILVI